MIFVTVGSQKFQFNRLLQKIDELIENGIIKEKVYAQIGVSDYVPRFYEYTNFMNSDSFSEMESKACILITHGGTGTIIRAVKKGKKVIAVPRLAKYGEHVDDHQLQLLRQFDDMKIIKACYDLENLAEIYKDIQNIVPIPYKSNTNRIIEGIEN
ncbi:PssE/Cps14G family polysaccharide biosynthesis glycosyltransferase [Acetivibrio straminisolvens]|uniref:Glycosyltransferase 28-like protein n=2 Tax=Acetivibrio straminisolvens TaxID=253314 RepID=W4V988_9FIRM|nr:PssE/Cps14G family polysaccharide biosynthesis glycosyltransferase [Acetivibrio straminisolvens]GAE89940.1 glycosyltransferase 28-like protein [Acetivibrio straminisolvens JCM 21531]